jgi:hypothetical protein
VRERARESAHTSGKQRGVGMKGGKKKKREGGRKRVRRRRNCRVM